MNIVLKQLYVSIDKIDKKKTPITSEDMLRIFDNDDNYQELVQKTLINKREIINKIHNVMSYVPFDSKNDKLILIHKFYTVELYPTEITFSNVVIPILPDQNDMSITIDVFKKDLSRIIGVDIVESSHLNIKIIGFLFETDFLMFQPNFTNEYIIIEDVDNYDNTDKKNNKGFMVKVKEKQEVENIQVETIKKKIIESSTRNRKVYDIKNTAQYNTEIFTDDEGWTFDPDLNKEVVSKDGKFRSIDLNDYEPELFLQNKLLMLDNKYTQKVCEAGKAGKHSIIVHEDRFETLANSNDPPIIMLFPMNIKRNIRFYDSDNSIIKLRKEFAQPRIIANFAKDKGIRLMERHGVPCSCDQSKIPNLFLPDDIVCSLTSKGCYNKKSKYDALVIDLKKLEVQTKQQTINYILQITNPKKIEEEEEDVKIIKYLEKIMLETFDPEQKIMLEQKQTFTYKIVVEIPGFDPFVIIKKKSLGVLHGYTIGDIRQYESEKDCNVLLFKNKKGEKKDIFFQVKRY